MSLQDVNNLRTSSAKKGAKSAPKVTVSNADFTKDLPDSVIDLSKIVTYEAVANQKLPGPKPTKKGKEVSGGALAHPRNITKDYHSLSLKASPKKAKEPKKADKRHASPEPKWQTPARTSRPTSRLLPSGPPRSISPKKLGPVAGTPAGRLARGLKSLVAGDTSPVVAAMKGIAGKRKEAKQAKTISQSTINRFKEWKKGKGGKAKQSLDIGTARTTRFSEIKDTAPAVIVARPKRGTSAKATPAVARKVGQKRPPPPPPKKAPTKPVKKTRRS